MYSLDIYRHHTQVHGMSHENHLKRREKETTKENVKSYDINLIQVCIYNIITGVIFIFYYSSLANSLQSTSDLQCRGCFSCVICAI